MDVFSRNSATVGPHANFTGLIEIDHSCTQFAHINVAIWYIISYKTPCRGVSVCISVMEASSGN